MNDWNDDDHREAVREDAAQLLASLVQGRSLASVVPWALELVEREPLLCAAQFPGDLLRGLMEVPDRFWSRNPVLYRRHRAALRAAAALRRTLPPADRMTFWEPLDPALARSGARITD